MTCFNFFAKPAILIVVSTLTDARKQFLPSEQHWNLVNIVFMVAKPGNICFGHQICVREAKMFLTSDKNTFCFRAAKFVSANYVSHAAKLGNIYLRNNVSKTLKCYFKPMNNPLGVSPSKGKQGTTRGKEKIF